MSLWIYRAFPVINKYIYLLALIAKLIAGVIYGLIYTYYYEQAGDSFYIFKNSVRLASLADDSWIKYLEYLLWHEYTSEDAIWIDGYSMPRVFAFIKLTSVVNLLGGNNYWITSIWFSFFSFFGFYYFASRLIVSYPKFKIAILTSFLFYPSVLFWSSGLSKEAIVMPALLIPVGYLMNLNRKNYIYLPIIVFLAWLSFTIKFYYTFALFPFLSLYLIQKKFGIKPVIAICGLALIVSLVAMYLKGSMLVEKLLSYILYSHDPIYGNIGTRSIDTLMVIRYHSLTTNFITFLYNIPKAMFSMLYTPIIGESRTIVQLFDALSNTFLLLLSLLTFQNLILVKKFKIGIEGLLILSYVLFLGISMAFCAPNLGTLARYKIGYQPFMILILMIGSRIDNILSSGPLYKKI